MSLYRMIRDLRRVGQVTVGTAHNRHGEMKYVAACAAADCGWSAEYDSFTPAEVAARGHRCRVR
ncbi:mobile element transfer protein [Streptomyces alboflavus]|uniref:mobile element transfer protein n=1 Tax=Streptomyces alboflavus TaxID=67267 RepID=UPI003699A309